MIDLIAMIGSLTFIALNFLWLCVETDWFRLRFLIRPDTVKPEAIKLLPAAKPVLLLNAGKHIDFDAPYWWMTPELKKDHIMLCHNCYGTTRGKCPEHKADRWASWKLPARTIKAFGSTLNLNEGCNIQRALLLKTIARELTRKTPVVKPAPFQTNFIEAVRTGSHNEFHATDDKGHGWHQVVNDYKTVYHDCLVPGSWIKEHEHDLDGYEPTIEIAVDGGKNLSVDGNYKQGMIKDFMADYVTKARIGRKSVNLNVGIADKVTVP